VKRLLSAAAVGVLACALSCGASSPAPPKRPVDLLNPYLGPEHAAWLEGAVARMASPDEVTSYLALRDDTAAEAYIEAFWERRNPHPGSGRNPVRGLFDQRAAEADKRFSESGRIGRTTDRGAVFVLYGEPSEIRFDAGVGPREPDAEVWLYKEPRPRGIHGHPPQPEYRFARVGDVTIYIGAGKRPQLLQPDQPQQ
jgi:GWxTD domain-containing protein